MMNYRAIARGFLVDMSTTCLFAATLSILLLDPGSSDITMAEALLAEIEGCHYVLADKGYDSDKLRTTIRAKGAKPVIPGRKSRKRKVRLDTARYKFRWMAEAVFCRLKDFRRVATRYDKLARNYASTLAIATIVAYWL